MDPVISKFLTNFNITLRDNNVKSLLQKHINQMIFNITSLSAITALTNNKDSISKSDVDEVYKILNKKLSKKMKGGVSMPSDFFGYSRAGTTYTEGNESVGIVNVSKIDFAGGIARPSQGPVEQSGGASSQIIFTKSSKYIKQYINKIISTNYIVKLPSKNIKYILSLIDFYLNKLGLIMKDKTISEDKFKKLIKNKQLSIFN